MTGADPQPLPPPLIVSGKITVCPTAEYAVAGGTPSWVTSWLSAAGISMISIAHGLAGPLSQKKDPVELAVKLSGGGQSVGSEELPKSWQLVCDTIGLAPGR